MLKKRKSIIMLVLCLFAFTAGAVLSSEENMKKLPLYERYRCAICHKSPDPVPGNAELNPFGTDFHNNGDKWDAQLAGMDSDGDSYSNGRELGDNNGDGVADVTTERSNPGDPLGTPSSVDENTWGVIKKLFGS